jgi:hypothetical protein
MGRSAVYDAWDPDLGDPEEEELKRKVPNTAEAAEYVLPNVIKPKVKVSFPIRIHRLHNC